MIIVHTPGREFKFAETGGYLTSERGELDVKAPDQGIIATFAAGQWICVHSDEPGPFIIREGDE